jgi:hypothetical protein
MGINYEILHVEIKNNRVYVSLKIIKNGSVEIFNSVPIENINLIVENFSFNPPHNQ